MRVDASLVSLLLAATASAQHSYNATTGYNSTASGHLISELEKEVQDLRAKLEAASEAASQTCQAPAPGQGAPAYGQSGSSASGSASGSASTGAAVPPPAYGQSGASSAESAATGSPAAPPAYNGQTGAAAQASTANAGQTAPSDSNSPGYYIHTGYGYPSDAPHSEASPAETQPAGYPGQNSGANGASAQAPQSTEGAANGASQQPAGYNAPSQGSSGAATSGAAAPAGYGSSAAAAGTSPAQSGNGMPAASPETTYSNPDYYAPYAPSETSTNTITSTKTVIVSAGTITVSESKAAATESSDDGVYTCTETYHGTAPIPSPPVSTSSDSASASASASGVVSSLSSSIAQGISATAPYGYGNGTSSGFLTGTAKAPVSSGTGAASATFACNPAHQYPNGAQCVSSAGSLTLVTPSASATSSVGSAVAGNGTSAAITGTGSSTVSAAPTMSANSTSTSTSSSASASATSIDCSAICDTTTKFNDWDVTPLTCTQLKAGTQVNTPSGQSSVGCAASFTPALDICQVTLNVKTSGTANTYMEVWLPNGNSTAWNGRSMNTDNGGLNGCVHYVDMQYVSGLGFAAIGDNAGHNGSSFDGTWTLNNNEAIVDWAYRARHAAVDVGKQVIDTFYSKKPEYSYYIGCSAGGAQGLQSAQKFPNDFDGIIAGASANDFNHLQDWSAHFRQLTGSTDNDTFLTQADWTTVQSYILDQCDEKLDGVNDGILEDPTICDFDISAIPVCSDSVTSGCLNPTQIDTVEQVFKPLYNAQGALIYPPLLYGAQVDAFRLGLLSGSIQGISQDWFRGGVYNDSSFNILDLDQQDYARADELDDLHGNPSAFNSDLSGLRGAGGKLIMYHGMADPMTSGYNSQRYYQKVAKTMGASNTDLDEFFRFFRISGMAHCGVGGISGAGAWEFGQSGAAASASNNIVDNLVSWVEKNDAPDVMLGTKFWYDTPSLGIEFERPHCRYPYRTTFDGGDSTKPENWSCKFIDNWQECEDVTCSKDGTFT